MCACHASQLLQLLSFLKPCLLYPHPHPSPRPAVCQHLCLHPCDPGRSLALGSLRGATQPPTAPALGVLGLCDTWEAQVLFPCSPTQAGLQSPLHQHGTSRSVRDHRHGEVHLAWVHLRGGADGVVAGLEQGELREQQRGGHLHRGELLQHLHDGGVLGPLPLLVLLQALQGGGKRGERAAASASSEPGASTSIPGSVAKLGWLAAEEGRRSPAVTSTDPAKPQHVQHGMKMSCLSPGS